MRWSIEIQKTSLKKRNLFDLLLGLGFQLIEGGQYPAFTSQGIDACLTAEDAFKIAKKVREAFKGPARIDPHFELGSVLDHATDPPRRSVFLEPESCVSAITVGTPTITISPPSTLSTVELEEWEATQREREYQAMLECQRSKLEPAFSSTRAAKVIELLAIKKPSAETVYKIYELAEGHPNNRATFHNQFGISKDQFDRFSDAVHNPTVSGDWARHAYYGTPRTENPMTKAEAESFVREMSVKWLQSLRNSS